MTVPAVWKTIITNNKIQSVFFSRTYEIRDKQTDYLSVMCLVCAKYIFDFDEVRVVLHWKVWWKCIYLALLHQNDASCVAVYK